MMDSDLTKPVAEIDRADGFLITAIAGIWGLMAILINPIGDFPLNDDWAYGLPAKWLVEDGRLRFTDWQSIPLIVQVVWGSVFALPGFSFTALRISTLTIAALGLAATYLSGREAGLARPAAVAAAASLLVNPMFVSLSNTFMTDVPCLSLMMLSLALLLHGLRRDRATAFWAGWGAVLLASLIRQVALAIPLGLIIAVALKEGLGRRWLVRAVLPAAAVLLVVTIVYPKVLSATVGLPSLYHMRSGLMGKVFDGLLQFRFGALKPLVRSFGFGVMHLGLWMLPLLLLFLPRLTGTTTARGSVAVLSAAGCVAAAVLPLLGYGEPLMPLGDPGNIVTYFGTGVRTLRGQSPRVPYQFWAAITAASAFGSVLLVAASGQLARRAVARARGAGGIRSLWPAALLLSVSIFYYLPVSMNYGSWFDRYTLPLIPLLALLFFAGSPSPSGTAEAPAPPLRRPRVAAAWGLAAVYLGFSVASTHDYLEWNRKRWAAGLDLAAGGKVPLEEIDGGFEFNNYRAWSEDRPPTARPGAWPLVDVPGKPRFVLSFSNLPGYIRLGRLAVPHWLPTSPDSVLILETKGKGRSGR